jgi:hypothetical protein
MICRYVQYEQPWAYYINCILWSNVYVIWGLWIHWFCDLGATNSQQFGHYKTDVISWCGLFEVELACATNVTYGMLCNGWGTDIVL